MGKLAIMGANLNPAGAYDWVNELVATKDRQIDEKIAKDDTSQPWSLQKQYFERTAFCTTTPSV